MLNIKILIFNSVSQKNSLINEVTETIANNLTDSEKKIIIDKLQFQELEIKEGIANPDSIIHITAFSSEQEIFKRWATRLKQLHYLGIYENELNTILIYIKKQIGKMNLDLDKKDNLYRNAERSLDQEYKRPYDEKRQDVANNTSDFCTLENSFMIRAIENFKSYHEIFEEISDILLGHLKDRRINKEFTSCLEWEEIAKFCSALEEMQTKIKDTYKGVKELDKQLGDFSTLGHIKEELNLKQCADSFRDSMYVLLGADKSFRHMAHSFGIVPRQGQRVRQRLEIWPKKEAKNIILKVMGSYGCPCGCGIDLVTNRRMIDLTSDKYYWQIRYRDRQHVMPEQFRQRKDITPIAIAEKVWGKKMMLVEVKP